MEKQWISKPVGAALTTTKNIEKGGYKGERSILGNKGGGKGGGATLREEIPRSPYAGINSADAVAETGSSRGRERRKEGGG